MRAGMPAGRGAAVTCHRRPVESDIARRRDRPPLWPALLAMVLLAAVVLGFVVVLGAWKDLPLSSLARDPVGTAGLRWQTGILYKTGVFLWGAVAATCLLGAAVWRGDRDMRTFRGFLLASAALTIVFALDDVFQFRGEILDHLGLSEVAVFAVYAVALAIFAIVFRSTLLQTEYGVLVATVALFVAWLALRHFAADRVFLQEAAKLLGQLTLLIYFFRTSAYGVKLPLPRAPGQAA